MADQEQSTSSTFPNPPPFWQDFTPDNLNRIEQLRKSFAEANPTRDVPTRLPDIPESLINLQPPAEPKDGRFRIFGEHFTVRISPPKDPMSSSSLIYPRANQKVQQLENKLVTLEEGGITNLARTHPSRQGDNATPSSSLNRRDVPHTDHALELKRLVKSLLLNFLELAGTLSINPNDGPAKVADLEILLFNIHHALNEYRPHQARESAAELMQEHLDRTRRETTAIRSQVEKARRVLEGLGSLTIPAEAERGAAAAAGEDAAQVAEELRALDRRRDAELWAATDAAFA
ncbi:unnamed protein product [Clonostachys chloroleuca]|uniref:Mediator of RNA polymerase II transcription subunit 7 n=1 Tax=Clonostachys chloroleuca TaxID=1926264 RepID=A0AA35QFU6_9HYPO|nr:unnamed protein product [Clonostachys chloroleuca]